MPKLQPYPAFARYTNAELKELIKRFTPPKYSVPEIAMLKKVLKGNPPDHLRKTEVKPESGILYLFQLMDEMSRREPEWAAETLVNLKLTLSVLHTKHTSSRVHSGNPYSICLNLCLMWIKSQLTYTSPLEQTKSLKGEFYKAVRRDVMPIPPSVPTQKEANEQISALVKRLETSHIMPVGASSSALTWDCRMLDMPIAGVCYTFYSEFSSLIELIARCVADQGFLSIAVLISSFDLTHAMAMIIRVRPNYISVVFYDPALIRGDAKVPLSPNDRGSWQPRIKTLLFFSIHGMLNKGTDLTLVCLNTNVYTSDKLIFPNGLHTFQSNGATTQDLSKFLFSLVACGGAGEIYLAEIMRLCTIQGININIKGQLGGTPLYYACANGNAPVVQILLQHPDIDVNFYNTIDDATPLYIASQNGHARVVEILLMRPDINANFSNKKGNRSLYIASIFNHSEVVRIFVQYPNIDLNTPNNDGDTPLFTASLRGLAAVAQILAAQPNIQINQQYKKNSWTPLHVACMEGHISIVRILMAHNADINIKVNGYSPLTCAINYKKFEIVELLLTRKNIEVCKKDIDKASVHGKKRLTEYLKTRMAQALKEK